MVLEWTPEEASLLQDRPFSAAASVYISREAWEAQTFSTINDSLASQPPFFFFFHTVGNFW